MKNSIGVCVGACTVFPPIKFDLSKWIPGLLYARHCLGPGFGCARTVLTPCLTDAVMKGVKVRSCELLYRLSRVGVVGPQLFRAAGNTETGFSNLISIAFIKAWQSFIKEGACQG